MTDQKKAPERRPASIGDAVARFFEESIEEAEARTVSKILSESNSEKQHRRRVEEALNDGARPRK